MATVDTDQRQPGELIAATVHLKQDRLAVGMPYHPADRTVLEAGKSPRLPARHRLHHHVELAETVVDIRHHATVRRQRQRRREPQRR